VEVEGRLTLRWLKAGGAVAALGAGDMAPMRELVGEWRFLVASKISIALGSGDFIEDRRERGSGDFMLARLRGSGDFILPRVPRLEKLGENLSRRFFGVVGEGGKVGSGGELLRRKSARDSSLWNVLCFRRAPGYNDNSRSSSESSYSSRVFWYAVLVLGDGGYR
jgi:hypothetical protein